MSSNNSGATSFAPADASDKVEFTITIVDPCETTTLADLTIATTDSTGPYSKAVIDKNTITVTFTRPTTTVETSTSIASVCGATSYSVAADNSGTAFSYASDAATTWAVISGPVTDTYTLTIDTAQEDDLIAAESSVTVPVYIKATLDNYTSRVSYTLLNVVINELICDCSLLAWDDPSDVTVSSNLSAGTTTSN